MDKPIVLMNTGVMDKNAKPLEEQLLCLFEMPMEEEMIVKNYLKSTSVLKLIQEYPTLGFSILTEQKFEALAMLLTYDGRR